MTYEELKLKTVETSANIVTASKITRIFTTAKDKIAYAPLQRTILIMGCSRSEN